jgi:hypothetical protein
VGAVEITHKPAVNSSNFFLKGVPRTFQGTLALAAADVPITYLMIGT